MNEPSEVAAPHPYILCCLILLGIASISCASILIRLADAPPLAIAGYRVALASFLIAPCYAWGRRSAIHHWSRKVFLTTALSGVFLALHFVCWIYSLRMTSIASAATLVNSTPLFTALFSCLCLKESLQKRLKIGIFLTLAGSVLVAGTDFTLSEQALLGDVLALLGGLMAAGYLIAGRAARRSLGLSAYTLVTYGTAAALLLPSCPLFGAALTGFSGETYLILVLLAVVPQLVGHTTFNWALKYLPTTTVSILILGEPIGATLLGFAVFGETVSSRKAAGLLVLAAGILLSALSTPKE